MTTRWVWLVETTGECESQEIYGTRKRAVDSLVGTEVLDESRREVPEGDDDHAVIEVDAGGTPIPDEDEPDRTEPMRALTRREINVALREHDCWAHWPMDGAGNTFLSISRRRVR